MTAIDNIISRIAAGTKIEGFLLSNFKENGGESSIRTSEMTENNLILKQSKKEVLYIYFLSNEWLVLVFINHNLV